MKEKNVRLAHQSVTENRDGLSLNFAVNSNPMGVPAAVKEAMCNMAELAGAYPDPDCRVLSARLAEKYYVCAEHILCGSGADDLLYRLVFAVKPKRAVVVEPTFEEYSRALELVGCDVQHYMLQPEEHFTLNEEILCAISENCDMVFLCNPNNPTGQLADGELLRRIADCCSRNGVLLVVDECFMEFLPDWKNHTLKPLAGRSENLIVIDAFTKTYSLAGFRLGFCVSGNTALLAAMRLHGQAFSVSVPAQMAGLFALSDGEYMRRTYRLLSEEREWLLSQLQKLPVEVFASQANFLLLKTADREIRQKLLEKGVKVRDCSCFHGLSSAYCRVAIRTRRENTALVENLTAVLC